MSTERANTQRYESVLRVGEAISACREPEQIASTLAEQLKELLTFDYLDVLIFKEHSNEIEWYSVGKGAGRVPEVPSEELAAWHVYHWQELLHIPDWKADERFPRLKQLAAKAGLEIGSVVRLPLTTPYRRLGTLGIASPPGVTYTPDDISFLQLIARVSATAIDDALNLRRAQMAQEELQRRNDRLHLLLNLTNNITSNLDLREVLRASSANIREVMRGDHVAVSLADTASGKIRIYATDSPRSSSLIREDLLVTPTHPVKMAFETLKPVIASTADLHQFPPEVHDESWRWLRERKAFVLFL